MPTMDRGQVQFCWMMLDVLVLKPDCGTVVTTVSVSMTVSTVKMPAFSAAVSNYRGCKSIILFKLFGIIKDPIILFARPPYLNLI